MKLNIRSTVLLQSPSITLPPLLNDIQHIASTALGSVILDPRFDELIDCPPIPLNGQIIVDIPESIVSSINSIDLFFIGKEKIFHPTKLNTELVFLNDCLHLYISKNDREKKINLLKQLDIDHTNKLKVMPTNNSTGNRTDNNELREYIFDSAASHSEILASGNTRANHLTNNAILKSRHKNRILADDKGETLDFLTNFENRLLPKAGRNVYNFSIAVPVDLIPTVTLKFGSIKYSLKLLITIKKSGTLTKTKEVILKRAYPALPAKQKEINFDTQPRKDSISTNIENSNRGMKQSQSMPNIIPLVIGANTKKINSLNEYNNSIPLYNDIDMVISASEDSLHNKSKSKSNITSKNQLIESPKQESDLSIAIDSKFDDNQNKIGMHNLIKSASLVDLGLKSKNPKQNRLYKIKNIFNSNKTIKNSHSAVEVEPKNIETDFDSIHYLSRSTSLSETNPSLLSELIGRPTSAMSNVSSISSVSTDASRGVRPKSRHINANSSQSLSKIHSGYISSSHSFDSFINKSDSYTSFTSDDLESSYSRESVASLHGDVLVHDGTRDKNDDVLPITIDRITDTFTSTTVDNEFQTKVILPRPILRDDKEVKIVVYVKGIHESISSVSEIICDLIERTSYFGMDLYCPTLGHVYNEINLTNPSVKYKFSKQKSETDSLKLMFSLTLNKPEADFKSENISLSHFLKLSLFYETGSLDDSNSKDEAQAKLRWKSNKKKRKYFIFQIPVDVREGVFLKNDLNELPSATIFHNVEPTFNSLDVNDSTRLELDKKDSPKSNLSTLSKPSSLRINIGSSTIEPPSYSTTFGKTPAIDESCDVSEDDSDEQTNTDGKDKANEVITTVIKSSPSILKN